MFPLQEDLDVGEMDLGGLSGSPAYVQVDGRSPQLVGILCETGLDFRSPFIFAEANAIQTDGSICP